MPVLHEYKHDSGVYLRTAIDGTHITFQVYDSAARFLKELGYHDGDSVTWSVIKPLWEQGYVYTGNSGTTDQVENHLGESELDGLNRAQQDQLEDFFERQKRRSIQVPNDVYALLSSWHDGKYSKDRAKELVFNADDVTDFLKSIRNFGRSPLNVTGVDASKGSPTYDIISKEQEFRCLDFRTQERETDLMITFTGPSEHTQRLFIGDGRLRHRKTFDEEVSGYVYDRDLLEGFPAIIELLVDVPGYDLALDLWDFQEASTHLIQQDVLKCLQLDWKWCVSSIGRPDGTSKAINGVVEVISPIDYGIISPVGRDWQLAFASDGGQWSEGEKVRFRLRRSNGRMRATRLKKTTEQEENPNPGGSRYPGERGSTKYGGLTGRHQEVIRRAENGELDWFDGELVYLDRKNGEGYVSVGDERVYFSTRALSNIHFTPSRPVRGVLSEDHDRALYLEPREPEETGEPKPDSEPDSEPDSDEEPPRAGQSRYGCLRYLNRSYGSFDINNSSETILFRSSKFPISPEDGAPGMAFSFDVMEDGEVLRATNLQREPERDRTDDDEYFEVPAAESIPIDQETTNWIVRNASAGLKIFDSIEVAMDFGIDPSEYESSIKTFGQVDGWGVDDFSLTDEGYPVYQFSLDTGGVWSITHRLSDSRSVVDIEIQPESSPTHHGRAVDGLFVHWRPRLNQGQLSDHDRHEFVTNQGRYTEMVNDYLSLIY